MSITRACNYQHDVYGYQHMVGPYYELTPHEINNGVSIHSLWYTIADNVIEIIRKHGAVMFGNPADYDDLNNMIFIDIASDDADVLIAILKELSEKGWSTGIC